MQKIISTDKKKVDCNDIYLEEFGQSIKSLLHFKELWASRLTTGTWDLFQFAEPDFYFYKSKIWRQEENARDLLIRILFKVMNKYGISYKTPQNRFTADFSFLIIDHNKRIGFRFDDFDVNQDVNSIVRHNDIDYAVIIRTWKSGDPDEAIARDNEQYREAGLRLRNISLRKFFKKYFCIEEYNSFYSHLENYLQESREIIGYKTIKYLSLVNFATEKKHEEDLLVNWDYYNYKFIIIDKENTNISNYKYLSTYSFPPSFLQAMKQTYVSGELLKTMTGINEYAESFITSEWLYSFLKEKNNFDYTSVISGYLKSIEQLLYKIILLNVDNNCKITVKNTKDVISMVTKNSVVLYTLKNGHFVPLNNKKVKGFKYIDLTSAQLQYMDSSIGTFVHFLRNNPHILLNQSLSDVIADMVDCFRIECRNDFFHIHNLKNWDIVEKTRSNAIYLYFVLLGACIIPNNKYSELGIAVYDDFDMLCKKIRIVGQREPDFIFEYPDGKIKNLVYDCYKNPISLSEEGIEHYESLLFYDIGEFTEDTYSKLDKCILEKTEQKVYLTRKNIPSNIYSIRMNHKRVRIDI